MQTKRSTWTPLNHQLSNAHVFEERRNLLGKWFEKWTDSQRKQVLQDWFSRCSASQLKHLRQTLSSWVPEEALDFTRVLPRVISLYIFPFLDPRSLCRCAQVCLYGKNLTDPKLLNSTMCVTLVFSVIYSFAGELALKLIKIIIKYHENLCDPLICCTILVHFILYMCMLKVLVAQLQQKMLSCLYLYRLIKGKSATIRQENTMKAPSRSTYKLRKAKSLMFLSLDLSANLEALPANKDSMKRLSQTSQWNAGIRPGPVRPPVSRLSKEGLRASQRSHRSTPTVSLFEGQP
uniref:Uncharacterized LOC107732385 n=1 Tax=Sinocyclocheilus rhinocerous TaxID=307959 RepID=A0A673GHD3_9TELE